MYTQLGVLTKGTIIEVNVSELGMVTAGGKVVWGRWAQVVSSFYPSGSISPNTDTFGHRRITLKWMAA